MPQDILYTRQQVTDALRSVAADEPIELDVRADLARGLRRLGKRELELVSWFAGGKSLRAIGALRGYSKNTAARRLAAALATLLEAMNGENSAARAAIRGQDDTRQVVA